MTTALRRAGPADAPRLAALARWVWLDSYARDGVEPAFVSYLDEAFAPDTLRQRLQDRRQAVWLVETGPALQGFAQLRSDVRAPHDATTPPQTELERLYVAPPCTGRGLGARLLGAARRTWPEQGLWLSVWAGNEGAQRFYRREGGQVVGETDFILDGQAHLNFVFAWPAP